MKQSQRKNSKVLTFVDAIRLALRTPKLTHKQIDELASDPIRLSTALAKAKWVEQRLTIKLHRNAAQTRQPPNYPDALVPQQASLQKLDRSAVASFSKALRSRKRLKRQL